MDLTIESALSPGGLVGHLSYLLLVISMLMNRMSLLRLLVIASALTAIVYDWVWLRDPVGVFWESLLVTVNVAQLLILHWRNIRAHFNSDEQEFIETKLPGLASGTARSLLDKGKWRHAEAGEELTNEGRNAGRLTYIANGMVDVIAGGIRVSRCGKGDFIGEMTVLNEDPATATTRVNEAALIWQIDAAALKRAISRDPEIGREIEASFARNYRSKLVHSNALVSQGLVP